jgi:two-component system chemotaxis sensor kinase CheA
MQPIGVVWNKFPRVVRDVSVALGKQIRLEMEGAGTELDRTIIEAIKDPLLHMVRNSCDHGIEPPDVRVRLGKPPEGRLALHAYHEGGQVNIEIRDDGAGIDVARVKQKALENGLLRPEQIEKLSEREALNLIFVPGFSMAKSVSNVSGRGVGMDVVKSHIEKIGGVVDIVSRLGEGTTIKLKIPLTLAIIPGLVVTSGGERFVIPQVSLIELIRLEGTLKTSTSSMFMGLPCTGGAEVCCLSPISAGCWGSSRPARPMRSIWWFCRPKTGSSGWWWTGSTIPRKSWSSPWASS